MIFEQYLLKVGKAALLLQYFDQEEKQIKEEACAVYFKGQQLSKKQFGYEQKNFTKKTQDSICPDSLILIINNDIDGKFIFSQTENSLSKKFFIGVEFYKNQKLILKLFNNEAFEKELSEDFQDFLVRALIKTNFEDNYEISTFLGRGGFSYVHTGISKKNGQKVAIKKIEKLRLMQIKQGPKLIYSEILIMKKLQHPNIVKLIDVYQSKQYYYLIMEHLEGPTLQQIFKTKFSSLSKIQQFCKQFLFLLKYLENNKILHRDIKPANIIFKTNQSAMEDFCLIDFGLSVQINSKHEFLESYGTAGFMAPELMNKRINKQNLLKADIYSFGCIIFLLYFSKNVFRGDYEEVVKQNKKNDIPYLILNDKNNNNKQDCGICPLLKSMLTINSEERISLNELMDHPFFEMNKNNENKYDSDFVFEDMKEYDNDCISNQMELLLSLSPKFKFTKESQQSTELNSYLQLSNAKKQLCFQK